MNMMAFRLTLGAPTGVFPEPVDPQEVKKVVEIFNIFQNENQTIGSRILPYIPHVKHYSWKRQKDPFRVSDPSYLCCRKKLIFLNPNFWS